MKEKKIINSLITTIFVITIIISLFFTNLSKYSNSFIWGLATIMILISACYFTIKLKFSQLNIPKILLSLKSSSQTKETINTLESLSMSLAAKIGVGSLAGVALAIYIGGPGSIFWMWVSSLLCAINTFSESILGVIYKEKDYGKIYKGGPSYYIKKGLDNKYLALLYAIIIIIAYIAGFLSIQSNTIVTIVNTITPINPLIIVIIIGVLTALVILKGVKQIATFSSKIVPIMGLLYLALGLFIIINNLEGILEILKKIITDAFSLKSVQAGIIGTIIIGIQRGIFATESGLGTSAISSSATNEDPIKQGYSQVLGIHFTTFIICTITAFIILTSNYQTLILDDINGIEITSFAFQNHLGKFGNLTLVIVTILFAFTTIISGYYYGEANLKFIFPKLKKKSLFLFKIITIIIVVLGGIVHATFLWNLVDLFVAFLSIINIYAILSLREKVIKEYQKQKKR